MNQYKRAKHIKDLKLSLYTKAANYFTKKYGFNKSIESQDVLANKIRSEPTWKDCRLNDYDTVVKYYEQLVGNQSLADFLD